jgi:hypothetical protein
VTSPPPHEFGKRKPAPLTTAPSAPVKRSGHVALLMMGTLAVGGSAYALMPRENCQPNAPGMAAPSSPAAAATCASSSSSGGHSGSGGSWSRRTSFFGGDSASSSGTSTASGSTETSRGGFGSFARSIGAHFSGG